MARLWLITGVLALSLGIASIAQAAMFRPEGRDIAGGTPAAVLDDQANAADVRLAHWGRYYGPPAYYRHYYRPYYRGYYGPYHYHHHHHGYWDGGFYFGGPRAGIYIPF